jgi:hypothetical protein
MGPATTVALIDGIEGQFRHRSRHRSQRRSPRAVLQHW